MKQSGLADFSAGDGPIRPEAEAEAVAGDGGGLAPEVVDTSDYRYPDPDGSVDIAVTQVDYTVEGAGREERPVLHVFGRTSDNETEHVRVREFPPYFYTPLADLDRVDRDDGEPLRERDFTDDRLMEERITGLETRGDLDPELSGEATEEVVTYESIRGEALVKVTGQTPRDVGQLRDRFDHYEADILFPNRLLIDKDVTSGVRVPARRNDDGVIDVPHQELRAVDADADLRVNTFDIEVDDRNGFPEDGEERIVCLTSHDNYRDEYVGWLYEAPDGEAGPDSLPDYEMLREGPGVEVRRFDTEEAMLTAFLDYVDETDPDVLTGWNFTDFDAPYLLDRIDVLSKGADVSEDLDSNRLSRVNEVWRSDWQGPNIKGRVAFDLLYAYKRIKISELDSYRLDAVGEAELGVGKERYPGDIGDLWEDDPERLLEYNLRDVELCVELDRKQSIVAFWEEVATFVGAKLEDATTPGDAVDMYILHKVHGEFALPSKGAVDAEEYEGGAVFDPITGVKEMVSVLDLKSLYPMCMVTINASPETKVDPEAYDGDTYVAPNGMHFRKEPDGIIREMVTELLAERDEKKRLRDENPPGSDDYDTFDRQQGAVKVIMNSLYGVLGWDRFRLYDKDMGAAVTATGREVIEFTEGTVEEMGYEVAYGDTDSVMIELGSDVSKEVAIERSFDLEERINASYDDLAAQLHAEDHRFQIEFEKLYRRFFQAGKKKRYAGHIVWKEGKDVDDIDITGFEYKRSDIAPVTKEVQQRVLEMIVKEGDVEGVKEYVHDVIQRFESGQMDVDDVAIPQGIGKRIDSYETENASIRGAKYANLLLGTNFARGSKPRHVYLKRVHNDFYDRIERERGLSTQDDLYREFREEADVICIEYADQLPEEFEVDWDKMLDKTLKGPIERILEAIGVSWDEVRSGQTQTGLGSFV